jgi:hypothetical protein
MNKTNAKKIAETITFEQLSKMFINAQLDIVNWEEISAVNKCLTKGAAWNILFKGLTPNIMSQKLAIKNMIWEFGDHLDDDLKIKPNKKIKQDIDVFHQEPDFPF